MMRNTLSVGILFAVALSIAPAEAAYQEYKCHVSSTKKGEQVVFYRWKEKDVQLKVVGLPGKQLTDHQGKKYFIRNVFECVSLGEDFSSEKAKRLDERTLR